MNPYTLILTPFCNAFEKRGNFKLYFLDFGALFAFFNERVRDIDNPDNLQLIALEIITYKNHKVGQIS